MTFPPPGWYPDPLRFADIRYWNGAAWVSAAHPGVPAVSAPLLAAAALGTAAPPAPGQIVTFRRGAWSWRRRGLPDYDLLDVDGALLGHIHRRPDAPRSSDLVIGGRTCASVTLVRSRAVQVVGAHGEPWGSMRLRPTGWGRSVPVDAGGQRVAELRHFVLRPAVVVHMSGVPVVDITAASSGSWPWGNGALTRLRWLDAAAAVPTAVVLAAVPALTWLGAYLDARRD